MRFLLPIIYFLFFPCVIAQSALPQCPQGGPRHNCQGEHVFPSGNIYRGEWNEGKFGGPGEMIFANGARLTGYFSDSGRKVVGTLSWPSGAKHVGEFLMGRPNGNGTQYRPDGSVSSSGVWKDGVLQVTSGAVASDNTTQDKEKITAPRIAEDKESSLSLYLPDSILSQISQGLPTSNIVLMSVGKNTPSIFARSIEVIIDNEPIELKHGGVALRSKTGNSVVIFRKQRFLLQNDDDSVHLILFSSPLVVNKGEEFLSPQVRVLRLSRTSSKIAAIQEDLESNRVSQNYEMKDLSGAIVQANRLRDKYYKDAETYASEVVAQDDVAPNDEFVIDLQHHGITSNLRRYSSGICQLWISSEKLLPGDHLKFYAIAREVKSKRCTEVVVDAAGPGGDFMSGMAIGYYIRRHGWSTAYGGWQPKVKGGLFFGCASSCFNIFLSGVIRYSSTDPLSTHLATNPRTGKCVDEDSVGAQLKRLYYREMYTKEVYLDSIATPCNGRNSPLDQTSVKLFHGSSGGTFRPGSFKRF